MLKRCSEAWLCFWCIYPIEGRSPVIFTPLGQGLQTQKLAQFLAQQRPVKKKMEMSESSSRPGLASSLLCDFVSWRLTSIYEGTVTAIPLPGVCASIVPIENHWKPDNASGALGFCFAVFVETGTQFLILLSMSFSVSPSCLVNERNCHGNVTKVTSAITTENYMRDYMIVQLWH